MEDNKYKILGDIKIPVEKRMDVNNYVIRILNQCGIRKTKEINIARKPIMVLERVQPDENGMITFDYSIFEKIKRNISTYDTKTCELYISDRGYAEYGLAVNLIMVLLEAYTNGHCYVMYKDEMMNVAGYMQMLYSILGERLNLKNRGRFWEVLCFFHAQGNEWIFSQKLFDVISLYYSNFDLDQILACLMINRDDIEITEEITTYQRSDIKNENMNVEKKRQYLYYLIKKQIEEEPERLKAFLKNLLGADVEGRKGMASRHDDLGTIAELSLYMISPVIVHAYAVAIGNDFWKQWDDFATSGYCDTVNKVKEEEGLEYGELPFYKGILRQNEDEFLEFWDGANLLLSEEMVSQLEKWKTDFLTVCDTPEMNMEQYMANILTDLDHDWNCRYVDTVFVKEFLEHGQEEAYQKAMKLIRSFMDRDVEYYPELTKQQAVDWILRFEKSSSDKIMMSALFSLMANKGQRKKIFGF